MAATHPALPSCRVDTGSSQSQEFELQPQARRTQRDGEAHLWVSGLQFCGNQGEASWRAPWRRWGFKAAVFGEREESVQFTPRGIGQS